MNKKVFFTKRFKKRYKKLTQGNKALERKVSKRLEIFMTDRGNDVLKDHSLSGNLKPYRSFSVSGDVRIIYLEFQDHIDLVDIGTHSQVY